MWFTAGLSYVIGTTDEYNKLAQDAYLLCHLNNKLAHSGQPKPKKMEKKLYDSGAKGCSSSNLANGYSNLMSSIQGWVSNKDEEDDNKGIKLIKEFVETLYKEMTEERNKRK